jgi:hypothetical protein
VGGPTLTEMNRPSWTAIPAARSSLPVLRLRLIAVLGSLLLAALAGLFSAIAWLTAEPPTVDFSAVRPRAEAQATAIAAAWVDGRPTELAVADGVSNTFAASQGGGLNLEVLSMSHSGWRRDTVSGRLVETHSFVVETGSGMYRLAVPFVFEGNAPVLAAYPSLLPYVPPTGSVDPLEYSNAESRVRDVPTPVRDRIREWTVAYGEDNGRALRDIADDRSARPEQYRGLGGMTSVSEPEVRVAVSTTKGLVLRVRLAYLTTGAPGPITMDFDLLVTGEGTQAPRVVAWGPAGTGPSLERYQNRL